MEKGKSQGFEVWLIEKILNISPEDKKKFVPGIFSNEVLSIFRSLL